MAKNLLEIPETGIDKELLLQKLSGDIKKDDINPRSGKAFGLSYLAREEHSKFLKKVFSLYFDANALNPGAYPSLITMETEVVAMTAWMLNGSKKVMGSMTSGGTESIIMSVKAHRDQARELKGIKKPEIVVPLTAHPAFEKAGHYLDVKVVHAPLRDDYRADVDEMGKLVNENTIMLVGSAVCYPYGVIDSIPSIAEIALEHEIGCHVDACLGGFLLPWIEKAGYPISHPWDFRVEGVTSISADIHKYGYGPKPASTITYKSEKLRKYQFYVYSEWCGGIYGSPSMPGSRPGGAIAAAWASLMALGQNGYTELAKISQETGKRMCNGINTIEGLHVMGKPEVGIYAYTVDEGANLDMFQLIDMMEEKGWLINRMQNPPAAHHMTSCVHEPIVDEFLNDLKSSMEELKSKPPSINQEGQAAMYGMMATFDDRKKIDDLVKDFLLQEYRFDMKKKLL
ncbi:MAG: pyridoxal phosphate-dependent decarboxylase family protein [Candidatus Hodarchaeota archaeon]